MKETQLLKGVLEGCVLSIIKTQQVYGYELVQVMRNYGFTTIVGGTIYPLLQKLEKQGLIKSTSFLHQMDQIENTSLLRLKENNN